MRVLERYDPGRPARDRWMLILAILLPLAALPMNVAALNASQQSLLGQVESTLRAAEADLQAAQGSAGTAERPATGARLRLTQMRLDSARERLSQAEAMLGNLPEEDPDVVASRERFARASGLASAVDAILRPPAAAVSPSETTQEAMPSVMTTAPPETPRPDSTVGSSGPTASPAVPTRLDYRQEEALRNARFHLREAEAFAARARTTLERLEGPDASTLQHREIGAALTAVGEAATRHARGMAQLADLAEGHPQVQPLVQELATLGAKIASQRSRLEIADAEMQRLTRMDSYPEYDADFAMLQDLARRYGNFHAATEQPERLARVIAEDARVLETVQRIAETYAPLVAHGIDHGIRMERLLNHFQSQRGTFAAAALQYRDELPGAIQADLAEAERMADLAVSTGRPAFFGPDGGITQRLQFAEDKLLVLRAFGGTAADASGQDLARARSGLEQRARALEEQIIADNRLPEDRYRGADRDAIVARATDAWAHQQSDPEILAVRLPAQAWSRDTRWEWFDGAFHKIDLSRMQVQLVVRHDDRLAVMRPVNVHRDHMKGDSLSGHPLFAFDEPIPPRQLLLLQNVH